MSLPILSSIESTNSDVKIKYKPDSHTFVQFRISLEEYEVMSKIAQTAFDGGAIKAPTISALARASLITQANLALKVEQENLRIIEHDKKRRELQALTGPSQMFQNLPPLKF